MKEIEYNSYYDTFLETLKRIIKVPQSQEPISISSNKYPNKEKIKELLDKGYDYILTEDFINYLVRRTLFYSKIDENSYLNSFQETLYGILSNMANDYINIIDELVLMLERKAIYYKAIPFICDNAILLTEYKNICELVKERYYYRMGIYEIILKSVRIILAYCIFYQRCDDFNKLLNDIIFNDVILFLEKLRINDLMLHYNEKLIYFIVEELESKNNTY